MRGPKILSFKCARSQGVFWFLSVGREPRIVLITNEAEILAYVLLNRFERFRREDVFSELMVSVDFDRASAPPRWSRVFSKTIPALSSSVRQ